MGYTFHNVVSSTQGFTVGSSPQGELFRRKKKVLGLYLNKVCLERYGEIIGSESEYVLEELERSVRSNHNEGDVDVLELFQMYALRTSVFLSYGIHLDCYKKDSSLCKEILAVENQIIRFRSPSSNLADYVPMLRLFPSHAEDYRSRRDKYMNYFYEELVSKLGTSSYDNSIIGRILRNNQQNLSSEELQSICLTLVSAGLDNTSLNLNHLLGQLSQTHGLEYQTIARQLLLRLYKDSTTAYEMAAKELKSTYILALIHETLRFFTVLPLSLPRLTTKPIIHGGAVIPENTILIMNAYAANHDPDHFPNPDTFSPARWLEGDYLIKNVVHFGFGIGSRECSGAGLAVREMYTLVSRLLLVYEVHPPETSPMGLDCFEMNTLGGTSFEPRAFNVKLKRLVRV